VCGGLFRFKNLDTMLQGNARCEGRADAARRDREAKARAQEDETMEGLYRQHKQAMYESKTAEEDARIAAFLQKQQQDLERDERLVQRVRQDSDELRQLQEKLNMAEVCFPGLALATWPYPFRTPIVLCVGFQLVTTEHAHRSSVSKVSPAAPARLARMDGETESVREPSAVLTRTADGASR
jgi:hypothetical protein